MQPNRVGYTQWGRRYKDEYIVGPFAGFFPTKEPPSYWRSMADQSRNVKIPSWACKNLPRRVRALIGTSCTFGSVYDAVSKKALKEWKRKSPAEQEKAKVEAAKTIRNLMAMEKNLNGMRAVFKVVGQKYDLVSSSPSGRRQVDRSNWPAWANKAQNAFNPLNAAYITMATQVYANAGQVDAKSKKAVLPGPAVDAAAGLGFGLYEYDPDFQGSQLDGEILGACIAHNIEAEQEGFGNFVVTPTIVITGLVALTLIGVSLAVAWGLASEKGKRQSDNELASMRINAQKDIAQDPAMDAATKQQLLQNLHGQQALEEGRKGSEAEKGGVGEEITKALIPVVIGISALGLVFKVLENRLTGGN